MEYTIDAENQKLGRVATKIATLLMGKDQRDFTRNVAPTNKVKVVNASKISITEKKKREEKNVRYSGYPGGLKTPTLEETAAKKGMKEVLRLAVSGMLPKNKLRDRMLVNLKITD
jgi:large subunit ribosomal protein L13